MDKENQVIEERRDPQDEWMDMWTQRQEKDYAQDEYDDNGKVYSVDDLEGDSIFSDIDIDDDDPEDHESLADYLKRVKSKYDEAVNKLSKK